MPEPITTLARDDTSYETKPEGIFHPDKVEDGKGTPEEQEYRRVRERIVLDEDYDRIPVGDITKQIQTKIEALGNKKGVSKEAKESFSASSKYIGEWASRLNPNSTEKDAEIFWKLPDENVSIIFEAYKGEIIGTLLEVDRMLEDADSEAAAVVLNTLIYAKTAKNDLTETDIKQRLAGKVSPENTDRVTNSLLVLRKSGPIPFGKFVEEHFSGVDCYDEKNIAEIQVRIEEIEKNRMQVHQEVVRVFDASLKPSERKPFESIPNPNELSWKERWKIADRSRNLDTTTGSKYLEKSFWGLGALKPHETEHYIKPVPAKALRDRGDGMFIEEDVLAVEIQLYAEKKLSDVKGLPLGTAIERNPYKKETIYRERLDSLEACVASLERWDNRKIVGADGAEFERGTVTRIGDKLYSNGVLIRQPVSYAILVPGKDAYGNKIDERLEVSSTTLSKTLIAIEEAKKVWKAKKFTVDPEKVRQLVTMESPSDKVDQFRQKSFLEDTFDAVIQKRMAEENADPEYIRYLTEAKNATSDTYEKFIQRYGRIEEYRKIAETRVREKGTPEMTLPWVFEVEQEMYNVTVEMAQLESVLRSVTKDVLAYTRFDQRHENHLETLLRNLDREIFNRLATNLIATHEGVMNQTEISQKVRTLIAPYLRGPTREAATNTISSIIPHPTEFRPDINFAREFFDQNFLTKEAAALEREKELDWFEQLAKAARSNSIRPTGASGVPQLPRGPIQEQWEKPNDVVIPSIDAVSSSEADWNLQRLRHEQDWDRRKRQINENPGDVIIDTTWSDIKPPLTVEYEDQQDAYLGYHEKGSIPEVHSIFVATKILEFEDINNPDLLTKVNEELTRHSMAKLTPETLTDLVAQIKAEAARQAEELAEDEKLKASIKAYAAMYAKGKVSVNGKHETPDELPEAWLQFIEEEYGTTE